MADRHASNPYIHAAPSGVATAEPPRAGTSPEVAHPDPPSGRAGTSESPGRDPEVGRSAPEALRSRRGLFASLAALGGAAAACTAPGGGAPAPGPTTSAPGTPVPSAGPTTPAAPPTAAPSTTAAPTGGPSPAPVPPGASTPGFLRARDPVAHFLGRATFGATPELVAEVSGIGVAAWLDRQLNPDSIEDGTANDLASRFEFLNKSSAELHAITGEILWAKVIGLATATLTRMVWSKRQLLERMVDFWQAHIFNKGYPNGELWRDMFTDDREVMRPRALGRFSDLLLAETTSPAMIRRLNGDRSTAKAINENLGRELLELHTVGIGAGYSQAEVVDSARILTGLALDNTTKKYVFKASNHYVGPVAVLGFTSANASAEGGEAVIKAYLDYLAHHPATARNLAKKLVTYFVSDTPPETLVTKLAETYLGADTAIGPVLKALFTSAEFGAAVGMKTRAPLEDLAATMRVLGVKPPASGIEPLTALYYVANGMGMAPLAWPAPDGYAMTADRWVSASATIGRWNMHRNLVNGWHPKGLGNPTVSDLLGSGSSVTLGQAVDVLSRRLTFQTFDAAHRQALSTYLGTNAEKPAADNEYLVRGVASLILDSPYHTYG